MWTIITSWFSSNLIKIIGWGAIAASVTAILLGAKQSGRTAERVYALKKQSENVRKYHEIQDRNRRNLTNGDAANRMRNEWSRD